MSGDLLLLPTFVWLYELRFKIQTEASKQRGLLPLKQLDVEGKQTVAPQGVEPESGVASGVDKGHSQFVVWERLETDLLEVQAALV